MDIIIIGYGRMGRMVQEVAESRGHRITRVIDNEQDWARSPLKDSGDIAIEFSLPNVALTNYFRCLEQEIPLVTGTTGWHLQLDEVRKLVAEYNGAMLYASNFNIGVNIFFHLNEMLARLTEGHDGYLPSLTEVHHSAKADKPSGTAVTLAEGIIRNKAGLRGWVCDHPASEGELSITAIREGDVKGIHEVSYKGPWDDIVIRHTAHDRKGFAHGAVLAAEWLAGRKGLFEFRDILASMQAQGT